jgi:hypothetical protein
MICRRISNAQELLAGGWIAYSNEALRDTLRNVARLRQEVMINGIKLTVVWNAGDETYKLALSQEGVPAIELGNLCTTFYLGDEENTVLERFAVACALAGTCQHIGALASSLERNLIAGDLIHGADEWKILARPQTAGTSLIKFIRGRRDLDAIVVLNPIGRSELARYEVGINRAWIAALVLAYVTNEVAHGRFPGDSQVLHVSEDLNMLTRGQYEYLIGRGTR